MKRLVLAAVVAAAGFVATPSATADCTVKSCCLPGDVCWEIQECVCPYDGCWCLPIK